MAETSTGLVLLTRFMRHYGIGQLLANAQIAIAATSLTSTYYFGNSSGMIANNDLRGIKAGFWRPSNATAGIVDDWRVCGDVNGDTGVVTVPTWTDVTLGAEDVYMLEHGLHPQLVIEAMNNALDDLMFSNEDWLSLATDPGSQAVGTTGWTAQDTTHTKITTASSFNVYPPFIASSFINNTGADGGIYQDFPATRGEEVAVWWLCRADIGTAELILYDVTNSAALGTTVSTTEENWQVLHRRESVTSGTSGTESLRVRLQGDGAGDDIYSNGIIVYKTRDSRINLSGSWENRSLAPTLSYVTFGSNTAADVEGAFSMHRHLIDPTAYRFISSRAGANPYLLEWNSEHAFYNSRWSYPILINGRRAHSDIDGPFTRILTETTSADPDLFIAAMGRRLFADVRYQWDGKAALRAQAEAEFTDYSKPFQQELPPRQLTQFWTMGN